MKALNLICIINFFRSNSDYNYGFRNVPEWLLKIRLEKENKNLERNFDFSLINRLIVWTAIG